MDAAIEGKTLCDILARNATTFGDEPATAFKSNGEWLTSTWREYREEVARVALGLQALGVERGDCVALMTRNRPEHLVCDLAALHLGAIPVSLYNSFSADQVAGVAADCRPKVAVIEKEDQLPLWQDAFAELDHLVIIEDTGRSEDKAIAYADVEDRGRVALKTDRERFEQEWGRLRPSDPATIIYTSG
ncbi:MAG TPA: AMP-binding protein, partial [Actinomycetota bacterium]|nr:AMP-binding protein [Actinomycetota bacterium]